LSSQNNAWPDMRVCRVTAYCRKERPDGIGTVCERTQCAYPENRCFLTWALNISASSGMCEEGHCQSSVLDLTLSWTWAECKPQYHWKQNVSRKCLGEYCFLQCKTELGEQTIRGNPKPLSYVKATCANTDKDPHPGTYVSLRTFLCLLMTRSVARLYSVRKWMMNWKGSERNWGNIPAFALRGWGKLWKTSGQHVSRPRFERAPPEYESRVLPLCKPVWFGDIIWLSKGSYVRIKKKGKAIPVTGCGGK
jgi:hypothetical protein